MISNWVNVADCVCIQGCHGLAGFSFNPHTHPESSPADLALFQSIRPPGEEALFTDRQVIMFNKIPASLHFPLLFFPAYTTGVEIILLVWFYFSDIEPMSQKQM